MQKKYLWVFNEITEIQFQRNALNNLLSIIREIANICYEAKSKYLLWMFLS